MCLAVPGQILSIQDPWPDQTDGFLYRSGQVNFGGITKNISFAYVPEAEVGDYVIVHVGFAISVLDPHEAQKSLDDLSQLEAVSP